MASGASSSLALRVHTGRRMQEQGLHGELVVPAELLAHDVDGRRTAR